MLVRDLRNQQRELALLIKYAANGGIQYNALSPDEMDEIADLADSAAKLLLDKREIVRLTELVQQCVRLPLYNRRQAAAWLGLSVSGLRYAYDGGLIAASKPGHDLLFTHAELVRYNRERHLLAWMRERDQPRQQERLAGLFRAAGNGARVPEEPLDRRQLVRLTILAQTTVRMAGYTAEQAAAWLGLSPTAVKAVFGPGRDLVIPHEKLERYRDQQRYAQL